MAFLSSTSKNTSNSSYYSLITRILVFAAFVLSIYLAYQSEVKSTFPESFLLLEKLPYLWVNQNWIPEIMYEETDEGQTSAIPFIMVPNNEEMPKLLYVFESRETEEVEPGPEGEELPIVEWDLHQYADMLVLKNSLDEKTYDSGRSALGLEPLSIASEKGAQITNSVRQNLE